MDERTQEVKMIKLIKNILQAYKYRNDIDLLKDEKEILESKIALIAKNEASYISLELIRVSVDRMLSNGFKRENLITYCSLEHKKKVMDCFINICRIPPTSTRKGFIGEFEIDGIPIISNENYSRLVVVNKSPKDRRKK